MHDNCLFALLIAFSFSVCLNFLTTFQTRLFPKFIIHTLHNNFILTRLQLCGRHIYIHIFYSSTEIPGKIKCKEKVIKKSFEIQTASSGYNLTFTLYMSSLWVLLGTVFSSLLFLREFSFQIPSFVFYNISTIL